jgi:hypothetical protein
MLRATDSGLALLRGAVLDLVGSSRESAEFAAVVTGSPAPYDEFLQGLRIVKGGAAQLSILEDRWLELRGPSESIAKFAQKLVPIDGGGHRHWYSMPTSLIIEQADDGEI